MRERSLVQFINKEPNKVKKMINKIISLFIFLMLSANILTAQYSFKEYVEAGDLAMTESNFYAALKHYSKAIELKDSDADLWYKYGKAAFNQNSYNRAEEAFSHYLANFQEDNQDGALYYLASTQHLKGKYDDAITNYNLFMTEYGESVDDESLLVAVKNGLSAAEWAKAQPMETSGLTVNRLGEDVNSPYSEQGAYLLDDKLYFASLRFPYGSKKNKSLFSKILVNEDGTSMPITDLVQEMEDGSMTSNPSFSPDGQMMFYTVCNYDIQSKLICKIHYAIKSNDGTYGNSKAISSNINSTGYTTTQPSVRIEDDLMYLYFVSDRPGGDGGLDIWMSNFNKNMIFSTPVNTGINTPMDDITPFFHHSSNTLYFSSNGRDGFGGFDLYKNVGEAISNLGAGYNTSYNDIYYFLNEEGTKAYLSSNRLGSNFTDETYETCCYDIYEADIEKQTIDLKAFVFNGKTNEPLDDSRMILKNLITGEVIYDSNNPNGHDHTVSIDCNAKYELTIERSGFQTVTKNIGDYMAECGKGEVEEKINMYKDAIILTVNTFDKTTNQPLDFTGVKLICEDTGQEAERQTGGTNNVTFNLSPDCTNFKLVGSKIGYESGMLDFSTEGLIGEVSKDLFLTEQKIATLEGMIPVSLYFDNDHPNPSSNAKTTNLWYSETYDKYYPRKQTYVEKYGAIRGEIGKSEVRNFFDNEVKKGNDHLQLMLETLLEVMRSGQTVNLYLRGFASPLADSEYNLSIGQRRVHSVQNAIKKWDGGALMKYINSGQLIITERSFGETSAPTGISDAQSDALNSIYSPQASRERRVEIDEIKFNN